MNRVASQLGMLSPRGRRAVGLMVLAVVVIGAASAYYLRPHLQLQPTAAAKPAQRFPVQREGDFINYEFQGPMVGWAVEVPTAPQAESGRFWVYKTVDGARHWRMMLTGETGLIFVTATSLHFADLSHGFVVAGNPLTLYRTSDGGASWSTSDLPSRDTIGVHLFNPGSGWAWSAPRDVPNPPVKVYWTDDGGTTWTLGPALPCATPFATFRNRDEGWVGCSDPGPPAVYLTLDGGSTWTRHDPPPAADASDGLSTYVRLLPSSGAMVWVNLDAYTTFDGGQTWSRVLKPAGGKDDPWSYVFLDDVRWWAAEGPRLYKSIDAGRTWTAFANAPPGLDLIQVLDVRRAWARIDEGYGIGLGFTTDGGAHWTGVNVPRPA